MAEQGFFSYGMDLAFSDNWDPGVINFFSPKNLQWLVLFFLSPVWLLVKVFATIGLWIHGKVKDWPWFFIKFALFELVLVSTDIGSDTAQGIRLIT